MSVLSTIPTESIFLENAFKKKLSISNQLVQKLLKMKFLKPNSKKKHCNKMLIFKKQTLKPLKLFCSNVSHRYIPAKGVQNFSYK